MKGSTRLIVAAIALLSGFSAAAAADNSTSKNKTKSSSMSKSTSQLMTKDKLSLAFAQRRIAWEDISQQAAKQKVPAGFAAKVGAAVPSTIVTQPVPVSTSNDVPALRPYQFALLKSNRLLIVNPSDNKVAEVINR